ncbi:MAG: cupin domain-containing protein [Burkholderiaceae bacterium]
MTSHTATPVLPLPPDAPVAWLGGLSPRQFMRRYWQKKPLLVRGAFSSWAQSPEALPVSVQSVLQLARTDRLPSRLVNAAYEVYVGPFRARQIPSLKTPNWTILVQQVNSIDPAADRFLDHFRFLPEGRLDDLMISVAGDRGGIGAHVDSYDVFLVQAQGQRRWETAEAFDPTLVDGLDLKILKRFQPEQTMVLGPGDLLYLPPGVAHRGTAIGSHCMTYSVGFRVPNAAEIADMALGQYLDQSSQQTAWSDPWLEATDQCGRLPDRLVLGLTQQAMACLPTRREIAREVVVALSAPHPSVYFDSPSHTTLRGFHAMVKKSHAIRLGPATRLLLWNDCIAINGEPVDLDALSAMSGLSGLSLAPKALTELRLAIAELANTRCLNAHRIARLAANHALVTLLWHWYCQGFLLLSKA